MFLYRDPERDGDALRVKVDVYGGNPDPLFGGTVTDRL